MKRHTSSVLLTASGSSFSKSHRTCENIVPKRRGFTLIELMVALTGSLFFVVFVFMLSRDVSRFFQSQIQLSDSTVSAINGFERLRADIARAGFLASPNLARDQNRCPRPDLGVAQKHAAFDSFPGLQQMGLARIIQGTFPGSNYVMVNNGDGGINPDQLVLYGNYTTADEFPVRSANWSGTGTINLEPDSNALIRAGYDGTAAGDPVVNLSILQSVFRAESIIRIVDETGREQYSIVDSVAINSTVSPSMPVVTLKGVAVISKDRGGGATCGMRGQSAGATVNPVDIIRYEVADIRANASSYPQFQFLFEGAAPEYDDTRLDLVRYRLPADADPTDAPTEEAMSTAELVAEYAVDLKFGVTALTDVTNGALTYFGEDDATLPSYAGVPHDSPANGANLGPHLIRGIHARLSVRNRAADLDAPLLADPASATSEQLFRVEVADKQFATLRSLRSHVATRNTRNVLWN